jgi:hypothetical protein
MSHFLVVRTDGLGSTTLFWLLDLIMSVRGTIHGHSRGNKMAFKTVFLVGKVS